MEFLAYLRRKKFLWRVCSRKQAEAEIIYTFEPPSLKRLATIQALHFKEFSRVFTAVHVHFQMLFLDFLVPRKPLPEKT